MLSLDAKMKSQNDCELILRHWLSQPQSALVDCPLQLPQFGQWLYLYITDARMTVIQQTSLFVLAAAGHPLAQCITVVDKASHSAFFGETLRIQQEMAMLHRSWTQI